MGLQSMIKKSPKYDKITRRIIAQLIDMILFHFLYFTTAVILSQLNIKPSELFIMAHYILLFIMYHTILEYKYQHTIGMFLTSIQVVNIRDEYAKLPFYKALIRSIIFTIEYIFLFVPCLIALFNKQGLTLHDMLTLTKIIKTRE